MAAGNGTFGSEMIVAHVKPVSLLMVRPPDGKTERERKEWVLEHYRQEILDAMVLRVVAPAQEQDDDDEEATALEHIEKATSQDDETTSLRKDKNLPVDLSIPESWRLYCSPLRSSRTRPKGQHCSNASLPFIADTESVTSNTATATLQSFIPAFPLQESNSSLASTIANDCLSFEDYCEDEEEDRWDRQRLMILDKVSRVKNQLLQSQGPKVVYACLITNLLNILRSGMGFLGEAKYDQKDELYLQIHAVKTTADEESDRQFHQHPPLTGSDLDTLVGQVITERKPIVCNDPNALQNLPLPLLGQAEIHSFLGIPLFDGGGRVIGNICIANQITNGCFSDCDVDLLLLFQSTASDLIQAYNQVEVNQKLVGTLDETVIAKQEELQALQQELKQAHVQHEAARRLQLQNFACMSHELRTPLNCIIGMSSLLLEETSIQDKSLVKDYPASMACLQDSIRMIVDSGELLLTVVNDVLDYSKLETGNFQVHLRESSLQSVLQSTVNAIQAAAAKKDIQVECYFGASVPHQVQTDPSRLQQILYNLLGNAIKFSPSGGVVEFHVTSSTDADPSEITSQGEATRSVQFVIRDYGPGIANDDFDAIFQPFRQVQAGATMGGTGLGLSISKTIIEKMRGTLSVDSVVGQWTTFTVDLPLFSQVHLREKDRPLPNLEVLRVVGNIEKKLLEALQERGVTCLTHDSLQALYEDVKNKFPEEHESKFVCLLVQEDLFDTDLYISIQNNLPFTALTTFGPKYTVNQTALHNRSLSTVLPSFLIQELEKTIEQVIDCPAPRTHIRRKSLDQAQTVQLVRGGRRPKTMASLCILVAEDNLVNQKVLSRILQRIGVHDIVAVDNGQKVVERQLQRHFDVILMDVQMPVMDGIDACRKIRQCHHNNGIPIIFVTAHASGKYVSECKAAGGNDFITKPYTIDEIKCCLQSLVDSTGES